MTETTQTVDNPFEGWVPLDEAAQIVGFSRTAVRYWADQGYIQAHTVGQRIRLVHVDEVTTYANERRQYRQSEK